MLNFPQDLFNLSASHLDCKSFQNLLMSSKQTEHLLTHYAPLYLQKHSEIFFNFINCVDEKIPLVWQNAIEQIAPFEQELRLSNYKIIAKIPDLMGKFCEIKALDCLGILTLDSCQESISLLKKLEHLRIENVSKNFFASIAPNLATLCIKDVKAIGIQKWNWQKLQDLKIIQSSQNFEEIQNLHQLTSLNKLSLILTKKTINSQILTSLKKMSNLEYLNLSPISCEEGSLAEILDVVSQVKNLKEINLEIKVEEGLSANLMTILNQYAELPNLGKIDLNIEECGAQEVEVCQSLVGILSSHIRTFEVGSFRSERFRRKLEGMVLELLKVGDNK